MSEADDRRFMAEALSLARRNLGFTATNPAVGCLIVKDGEIIAEAVTAPGGRPHAEAQALALAGEQARGATAYVTLEPCSHWGKTPPCANALVEAGVARVVVAVNDPDPRVSGRGYGILRDAGIVVETGLMEPEGRRQLSGYLMRQINKRPYVTLKLAVSADGMLGRPGEEVAITGAAAREQVHRIRAESDGILVGIGTVLADDPELTVRLPGLEERSPIRIVLDHDLRLPVESRLVKSAGAVPVIVVSGQGHNGEPSPPSALPGISPKGGEIKDVTVQPHGTVDQEAMIHTLSTSQNVASRFLGNAAGAVLPISPRVGEMPGRAEGGVVREKALDNRRGALTAAGVEILEAPTLSDLLTQLADKGISNLMVEGGAKVANAFLEAGLVDRITLFESDVVIGKRGLESPITRADMPQEFSLVETANFGPDRCFVYERPF
ncbi:bifunctional diaminohydroxyphosphoribosylaminopyrimidine deaminase/5-amino-6-(5-phosphoribosylamino)uracil reductase RibD [Rhizobium oryzicola]|uniref:Riboflavin biosynthesis protein RibD n=1 Tax=Rhizobium oryzicola TaxID=1232668 RepID=A0ABT8SVN9_9HYPH|nr:bifunctional diaminohydroxyphosphoribosylaminopyrimidine deaminase/5-amino-6-(5-phosphoribosylamino)uracil reductase RibD [Rhizobium oryzicola]MDO1581767.1 bifunctional diaminohydroxyphosphoribosylaminopyrimidine deaminase/5-amino-6-(5-phosphoribosylamino)uracil reductase RibD [Rhizobium oryzicola]